LSSDREARYFAHIFPRLKKGLLEEGKGMGTLLKGGSIWFWGERGWWERDARLEVFVMMFFEWFWCELDGGVVVRAPNPPLFRF